MRFQTQAPSAQARDKKGLGATLVAFAILGAIAKPHVAHAQTYPTRPITMNVPFAAGGPTDTIARVIAQRMSMTLGQSIIIENVTGADGTIGVGRVARAAPDGYMLSVGQWSTHVLNGAAYALPYDLLNDFDPVALLTTNPLIIVTHKGVPASNLKELIDWLKANPESAMGIGSMSHRVSAVYFQNLTGTRLTLVPYRGAAPAIQDMMAGQIQLMFDQAATSLPLVRAGSTKPYAVTAATRLAAAPNLPTVDEAGLPGFHIAVWTALWAPHATPRAVIDKLNAAAVEAVADPAVRKRLTEELGQDIPPREQQTPEALHAYQKAEIEKWWPLIKAANIRPE
ncbi:MAG TPA: tripartite tricarboxylate transporter substrate-binding protein [Xanthobacteraceae bacterium]|nr:tripartite tricarboxylate transporter substrate-binding protein [Xanthobacteraceae bacterium]